MLSWMTKGHIYGGGGGVVVRIPEGCYQLGVPDNTLLDRLSRLVPATGALGCSDFVTRAQQSKVRCRVLSVPLAADLDRFGKVAGISTETCKLRLGFDPSRPLIGTVGRLQRWKGMHLFAEAMAKVLKSRPECQGVIVGGSHELEAEYAKLLGRWGNAVGLKGKLILAGKQKNVPGGRQAMGVFVQPPNQEPFGIG